MLSVFARRTVGMETWLMIVVGLFVGLTARNAGAQNLDEVLVFDSKEDEGKFDEGLVRQRLGLLNADGKPAVGGGGALVALVSGDGKKKGFDMKAGGGTKLRDAFAELKGDGAVFTLITHGKTGAIRVNGEKVAGFGGGTGKVTTETNCDMKAASQLDGAGAKKNLTVNLAVCRANAKDEGAGITEVSKGLKAEIESLTGTVSVLNSSANPVKVSVEKSGRIVGGVTLTQAQIDAVNAAITNTDLKGVAFKDQYSTLQTALDAAAGGANRVVATLKYSSDIGGTIIQQTAGARDFETSTESDGTCIADCVPAVSGWPIGLLMLLTSVGITFKFGRRQSRNSRLETRN